MCLLILLWLVPATLRTSCLGPRISMSAKLRPLSLLSVVGLLYRRQRLRPHGLTFAAPPPLCSFFSVVSSLSATSPACADSYVRPQGQGPRPARHEPRSLPPSSSPRTAAASGPPGRRTLLSFLLFLASPPRRPPEALDDVFEGKSAATSLTPPFFFRLRIVSTAVAQVPSLAPRH